mmetsp:Transcript_60790/g.73049  ORF Transcript_60790/g.73049 Transcript_60790/m.73049 type:complete len:707 (+) Transcript_60790:149-2269(+)
MDPNDPNFLKCPCCKNPWNMGSGGYFCGPCEDPEKNTESESKSSPPPGISLENLDMSIKPADNFYKYTNGNWMKNNPIPSIYSSWTSFLALHVQSQERLKKLLEEVIKKDFAALTEDEAKVAAYYGAALNESAIEEKSIEPLSSLIELCEITANSSEDELAMNLGRLSSTGGISAFWGSPYAGPDAKDSAKCIAQIRQGGINLPDRDYYFDEDKASKRDAYKAHISKMLQYFYTDSNVEHDTVAHAERIYEIELSLAEAHMTNIENRDPEATYNPMSVDELSTLCGNVFNFSVFLESATGKNAKSLGKINVCNIEALKKASSVAVSLKAEDMKLYLLWRVVHSTASFLPKKYVDEDFAFFSKSLQGVEEIKPRWNRAMEFTESALGEVLGQMYCKEYFDEKSKNRALEIVENVRKSLEERLHEVQWITSDATRKAALEKMSKFRVKIGYPDEWIDYSPLKISSDQAFLTMVLASRQFDIKKEADEMNAPTDRVKWIMTPQTVNAYYHPSLNEIVFPAAILQPPFFDPEADDAINYGGMGAVIGHEMTHGFDDQGSKYDANGNMQNWWTDADSKEYTARVKVMIDQASEFVVEGVNVKGELTCGENIADLGGLTLSLRALKSTAKFSSTSLISGFTQSQRFFLSWATCWRQNVTKERAKQLVTLDPHGPCEFRANGPLSNMPEFHSAFNIGEGSDMYKPLEDRVDIW